MSTQDNKFSQAVFAIVGALGFLGIMSMVILGMMNGPKNDWGIDLHSWYEPIVAFVGCYFCAVVGGVKNLDQIFKLATFAPKNVFSNLSKSNERTGS